VMKIDVSGNQLDPWSYDRDNGKGAAQKAISALYKTKQTNPKSVQKTHITGTQDSAEYVKTQIHKKTKIEDGIIHLGLSDVADDLGPKVNKVIKKQNY
ncbi:MAG: hypothetical protein KAJ54_02805, partial [Candidatus Aenigmarchaeota archaeon]|nr:hypothetical protein [Candidatus Aenigmarchaeota archaeon]